MTHTKVYDEYVLEDLKKNAGLTRPLRAGLIERLLIRETKTTKLHPNPNDEFSIPEIGPNYEIVQNYLKKYVPRYPYSKQAVNNDKIEKLVVEKIKPNGYMILNGHHRWLAACSVKRKKMPIKIVNVTQEEDILKAMSRTKNRICVSFDLDEVIIAPEGFQNIEPKPRNPVALMYRESIREGVPALIDALHNLGCDIWVYTGQYTSESQIRILLGLYKIKVDGIVNGMKNRKSMSGIKERFNERYDASIHVDVEGITCVDTKNKTYDTVDLVRGAGEWASEAIGIIREMDAVKKTLAKGNE